MADSNAPELSGTIATVDFIRHRNALLVRADLCPLFTDHYLHLADHKLHYTPEQDAVFRDALAAFALHCASRPLYEHIAWTINLQQPLVNIFLAGDNEDCTITGRLFTENVKQAAQNIFYSDSVPRRGAAAHRSVVNFTGANLFAAAQAYYAASEQRLVRYFHAREDEFAMLVSHPDCDLAWFHAAEGAGGSVQLQSETGASTAGIAAARSQRSSGPLRRPSAPTPRACSGTANPSVCSARAARPRTRSPGRRWKPTWRRLPGVASEPGAPPGRGARPLRLAGGGPPAHHHLIP